MASGGKRPGAGRPKGKLAKSTLKAQEAKKLLIRAYMEELVPITKALIGKAKGGDLPAIKELHDRVYGKSIQPVEADLKGDLKIVFDQAFNDPS